MDLNNPTHDIILIVILEISFIAMISFIWLSFNGVTFDK
jgi:hypothetical protein